MFSGIVEAVGHVVLVERCAGATRFEFVSPLPAAGWRVGDSVAVDGVCLTITQHRSRRVGVDAVAETLACTTLGDLTVGRRVNLERALRLGDRLGGHFVQGHVDATAVVRDVRRRGEDWRVHVTLPAGLRRFVALKGSITVNGVSLTVSRLEPGGLEVALVPFTLEHTGLGQIGPGDRVNLEVDVLARYLEQLAGSRIRRTRSAKR